MKQLMFAFRFRHKNRFQFYAVTYGYELVPESDRQNEGVRKTPTQDPYSGQKLEHYRSNHHTIVD